MQNLVNAVLREHGPLPEAILVGLLLVSEGGDKLTEQQWRDELTKIDLKVLEYMLPCGEATGLVYIHPGCTFRVLTFR